MERKQIYVSLEVHKKLRAWCFANDVDMQDAATEIISRALSDPEAVKKLMDILKGRSAPRPHGWP